MTTEFKMVPVEPTEEMLQVLHSQVQILVDPAQRTADIINDNAWWAAMLAAAPASPQSRGLIMSEVKRYDFAVEIEGCYSHYHAEESVVGDYVKFDDFERVTAELDTAKETLERWHRLNVQREAKVDALQQRLTAADERRDVLEGLLNLAQGHIGDASLSREIEAALKPAEVSDGEGFKP